MKLSRRELRKCCVLLRTTRRSKASRREQEIGYKRWMGAKGMLAHSCLIQIGGTYGRHNLPLHHRTQGSSEAIRITVHLELESLLSLVPLNRLTTPATKVTDCQLYSLGRRGPRCEAELMHSSEAAKGRGGERTCSSLVLKSSFLISFTRLRAPPCRRVSCRPCALAVVERETEGAEPVVDLVGGTTWRGADYSERQKRECDLSLVRR